LTCEADLFFFFAIDNHLHWRPLRWRMTDFSRPRTKVGLIINQRPIPARRGGGASGADGVEPQRGR
jgi:hypothetical protein